MYCCCRKLKKILGTYQKYFGHFTNIGVYGRVSFLKIVVFPKIFSSIEEKISEKSPKYADLGKIDEKHQKSDIFCKYLRDFVFYLTKKKKKKPYVVVSKAIFRGKFTTESNFGKLFSQYYIFHQP